MVHSDDGAVAANNKASLHLIPGSKPTSAYAAIGRRNQIFLGIRFSGVSDGRAFGVPGTTYVHARIRSTHCEAIANKLDVGKATSNIISLTAQQLALDAAWPGLIFESVNHQRASVAVGMFVLGSLDDNSAAIAVRFGKEDMFAKLVEYAIGQVPGEARMAHAKVVASWMAEQAAPLVRRLKKVVARQIAAQQAQQEFATQVMNALEIVAPHPQLLSAIYQKHKLAGSKAAMAHFLAQTKPTD